MLIWVKLPNVQSSTSAVVELAVQQYGDGIVVVASVSKTEEVSSILAHRASSYGEMDIT